MTSITVFPKGIWAAFIYEMKKYKTFRDGYHQGQKDGLESIYLSKHSDSSYRHKFGVLVACYEAGLVTDVFLDRRTLSVIAYKGTEQIYKFTEQQ